MTLPNTMQAAVYTQYGPPDVLNIESIPVPQPKDKDVLVKVHYSTVNRTDCGFLRAAPFIVRAVAGWTKPKSTVLGCEFSGKVVAIGNAVTDYEIGDRVFGFKDDDFGFGGHAQYTCMPEHGMMTKIPESIGFQEAAAALEGAHYALFYIRSVGVNEGQRILLNGGTGAIGSAALQICVSKGAEVTAVCAAAHAERVKAMGAIDTIDYVTEDFTMRLSEENRQFDSVFDAVGKSTFGRCKPLLKENGIYTSSELGPYCQNPFLALYTKWFSKKKVHFPIPNKNPREDADYLAALMASKQYQPLIDRTFILDDIREAFEYVETGEKIGNVLLEIPH